MVAFLSLSLVLASNLTIDSDFGIADNSVKVRGSQTSVSRETEVRNTVFLPDRLFTPISHTEDDRPNSPARGGQPARAVSQPERFYNPVCVDSSDAWNVECLRNTQIDICGPDQWLGNESERGSDGFRVDTGNQACIGGSERTNVPSQEVATAAPAADQPAVETVAETVVIVVTQEDLQRLNVGASQLLTPYPGENVGLVNRPMHMWTDADTIETTIDILDQPVQVRLTPATYHWNYGDGTTQTTTEPGSAVDPNYGGDTATSHRYEETGTYTAQVTVSYVGQFRVDDNPWTPIGGTLDVPSSTASMDIWRSRTFPVYEDCDENPNGWGCDTVFQENQPPNR